MERQRRRRRREGEHDDDDDDDYAVECATAAQLPHSRSPTAACCHSMARRSTAHDPTTGKNYDLAVLGEGPRRMHSGRPPVRLDGRLPTYVATISFVCKSGGWMGIARQASGGILELNEGRRGARACVQTCARGTEQQPVANKSGDKNAKSRRE